MQAGFFCWVWVVGVMFCGDGAVLVAVKCGKAGVA